MNVMRSVILEAPIEVVWAAVRGFDQVVNWNPGVIAAQMESGTATSPGSVRHLDIVDGSVFRETLLALSDQDHFYTYDIIEGPLACTNYISTHRFIPVTDGNMTLGIWSGSFDCAPADQAELEQIVGDNIYRDGMRGLNNWLKENHNG